VPGATKQGPDHSEGNLLTNVNTNMNRSECMVSTAAVARLSNRLLGQALRAACLVLLCVAGTAHASASATSVEQSSASQLVAFAAIVDGHDVVLVWQTASETNNAGFFIEMAVASHAVKDTAFAQHDFVDGFGTTEATLTYHYRVEALEPGSYTFRLKQVNYDGTFEYSPEVEVVVEGEAGVRGTRRRAGPSGGDALQRSGPGRPDADGGIDGIDLKRSRRGRRVVLTCTQASRQSPVAVTVS